MKTVFISDTHRQHRYLTDLPAAGLIVHAGDVSGRGDEKDILDFIDWFGGLDYRYKIFIAGNHDFWFERKTAAEVQKLLPENMYYLCDSGVEIENVHFWGSPITPWFYDWAFNRRRGNDIRRHWNLIPANTDVLITHGPPAGILDLTANGAHTGCEDLLQTIRRISPRYHLFGHIHEAFGTIQSGDTVFVNGSVLDEQYLLTNKPVEIDVIAHR